MGNTVIQTRNDTASNWSTNNPTLALGEIGLETDTMRMKVGDGNTAWNSLGYYGVGASFKYGLYTLSADQTSNLAVGNHVEFDTCQGSLGGVSTGSGQAKGIITLPAGKTYKITGAAELVFSSGDFARLKIYNRTSSAYIGQEAICFAVNRNTSCSTQPTFMAIITTSANTDIDLRINSVTGTITTVSYEFNYLLIEEYGGY